jgi:ectoine hydroxylase-related dioxygenase (phytanoyl-CoA dioxygenase family)
MSQLDDLAARFDRDGYIVLPDRVDAQAVAALRAVHDVRLAEKMIAAGIAPLTGTTHQQEHGQLGLAFTPKGGNHDINRWNLHVPSVPALFDPRLWAVPHLVDLCRRLCGDDAVLCLIGADTPIPGSAFQNWHQDFHRYGLTINIALVDVTSAHAPLEVKACSQRPDWRAPALAPHRAGIWHTKDELARICETVPTSTMTATAGTVIIRDQRLVHRGTALTGREARPMLSLWVKPRTGRSASSLDLPAPGRRTQRWATDWAVRLRRRARGTGAQVADAKRLSLANLAGRLVEELSCSDRDHRRRVPAAAWDALSPEVRHLLRYAQIDGAPAAPPAGRRSWIGTAAVIGGVVPGITLADTWLRLRGLFRAA